MRLSRPDKTHVWGLTRPDLLIIALVSLGCASPSSARDRNVLVHHAGVVLDARGLPASGAWVDVVDADDVPLGVGTKTGATGRYVLSMEPRSDLFLRATLDGVATRTAISSSDGTLRFPAAGLERRTGVRQLGPSAPTSTLATAIENFEDGSVADYTVLGGVASVVSPAAAHDGAFGLGTTEVTFPGWMYRATNLISRGDLVTAWVRPGTAGRAYVGFGSSAAGTFALAVGVNTSSYLLQYIAYSSPHETFAEVPFAWTPGKWYLLKAQWSAGGLVSSSIFDSDGVTLLASVSGTNPARAGITQGGNAWRGFGDTQQFDSLGQTSAPPPPSVPIAGPWALLVMLPVMAEVARRRLMDVRRGAA